MPRARKIWPKAGRNHYYTKIDGVQTKLGPIDKGEAYSQRILEKILRGQSVVPTAATGLTFARLADKFLDHSQATNKPETYDVHRYFLQRFKDQVGKRLVSAICEEDLDQWLLKEAQGQGTVKAGGRVGQEPRERQAIPWGESTQARARAVVLAAMNYGVKKLNLPFHPLRHVKPGTVSRRERILTAEEKVKIRQAIKGVFGELTLAIEQTGARPMTEVCSVTAADVDLTKGTWTLAKWKNSRKQKGKKRVIFLSETMKELTRKLMVKNPEGPLFRNAVGAPWSRQTVTCRFRKLAKKLGLTQVTAYTFRHTAINDALVRGVPVAMVAELFGTSIQTISKSYAHIDQKHDALREAMKMAMSD
jgi:integrase